MAWPISNLRTVRAEGLPETCRKCQGFGHRIAGEGAKGAVMIDRPQAKGYLFEPDPCPTCGGKGWVRTEAVTGSAAP